MSTVCTQNTARVLAKTLPVAIPSHRSRPEIEDRLERAFLFEKLPKDTKRLVFRPSRRRELESAQSRSEPKVKDLSAKSYPGIPSVGDLSALISYIKTPEDMQEVLTKFVNYASFKRTKQNLRTAHFSQLLKTAAGIGEFEKAYHFFATHTLLFKPLLNRQLFATALGIYALRVPFLSQRSKQMLDRLYKKASPGLGRELCLLYGLVEYGTKFGTEYTAQRTEECLGRISELVLQPRNKWYVDPLQVGLGLSALKKMGGSASIVEALSAQPGREQEVLSLVEKGKAKDVEAVEAESEKV